MCDRKEWGGKTSIIFFCFSLKVVSEKKQDAECIQYEIELFDTSSERDIVIGQQLVYGGHASGTESFLEVSIGHHLIWLLFSLLFSFIKGVQPLVIVKDQSSHLVYLNICINKTKLWKFELNWLSRLRDNNGRRNILVTRSCVLSDARFRDLKI